MLLALQIGALAGQSAAEQHAPTAFEMHRPFGHSLCELVQAQIPAPEQVWFWSHGMVAPGEHTPAAVHVPAPFLLVPVGQEAAPQEPPTV